MLKKGIESFLHRYQEPNWKSVLWLLFLVALIIRFPFFFRDYVDRDESTFIIMAQSWVEGNLPYIKLWDLKPPITFLTFASVISVFGKSFIAIRLMGTLLVCFTAFFTYKIAIRFVPKSAALWCSLFCVFFLSLFGSLQGVMSEHICTFFFVAALYILVSKNSWYWQLIVGLLFGLSVMSKLNMAYPLMTMGLVLLWQTVGTKNLKSDIVKLLLMGTGFVLLVYLTSIPYQLQGQLHIWWQSIFEAPLAYSQTKFHSVFKALPFVLVITTALGLAIYKQLIALNSKEIQLLLAVVVGVLASFMQTGKVNGHYLIQLYPFLLILMATGLQNFEFLKNIPKVLLGILVLLVPMESYLEYANIIGNKLEKGSFFNGEGIDVPHYITENKLDTKNIFFTEYHIGYWVLGVDPPTKVATHPSNITRDKLFPYMNNPRVTGMEELQFILEEIQPNIIVARKGKRIFDKKLLDFNDYIDTYLDDHYQLITTIDRGLIYQRLK